MRFRSLIRCLVIPAVVLGLAGVAHAAAFTSSANFASWDNGGYSVQNDVWNKSANPETIWANSFSNWGVSTHQSGGGVKSYPHVRKFIKKSTNSLRSCSSSFNVSVPGSGVFNASYDCWVPTEVMVWMYRAGGDNPIAKGYDSHGAIPSFTNVTVGGHTWNVYIGGNPKVVSFVRTSNTTSGSVDLKAVLQHAVAKGWVNNGTIDNIQFGFEVVSTNNNTEKFTCNKYSLSFN